MQMFFEHSYWIYLCYACFYALAVPTFVVPLHLDRMASANQITEFLSSANAVPTSVGNAVIVYEWNDAAKSVTWFMLFMLVGFFALGTTLFVVAYVKITGK